MIDTNILIYFFDGKLSEKQKEATIQIFKTSFNISVITKIEFLGFNDFFGNEKFEIAKEFINNANVTPLSDEMIEGIIRLKQQYNLKLGDAIIGATGLANSLTVVTRNRKDFDKISGLIVFNPFDITD